jgi:hypothetical protein
MVEQILCWMRMLCVEMNSSLWLGTDQRPADSFEQILSSLQNSVPSQGGALFSLRSAEPWMHSARWGMVQFKMCYDACYA